MSASDTKKPPTKLPFETAYQELEKLVRRMESGEQTLDQSLEDFERGVALMKQCHQSLQAVEQKVEILVKDNQGLFSTEEFDDDAD
ncbi:MAG: exodeoxyribonuclease VII small subunit [Proteobacteria bacterium]|jgi:exodeoxyribonuclease VII small subunit|nr:exodeoxyribonuclease VII small subunit [Pseudomonadota bacterium]